MARKSNDEKFTEGLFTLLFFVPFLLIKLLAFLAECSGNILNSAKLKSAKFTLDEIDDMDGISFEHYVGELLRRNGFQRVNVTKASGDFGVDIIAYKNGKKWAFQCKNFSRKVGVASVQEVYSGGAKYDAQERVVITNSYFTPAAIELAKSLGVLLWDRIKLAELTKANDTSKHLIRKDAIQVGRHPSRPSLHYIDKDN